MKVIFSAIIIVSGLFSPLPLPQGVPAHFGVRAAHAEDEWKKEFEAVCSRTDDAMSFSKEELRSLIARCDKLKSVLHTLDESTRKVYLRRLQICRDLFAFVLEAKEKE